MTDQIAGIAEGTYVTGRYGYRPIEEVLPGDKVRTASGSCDPIMFIGNWENVPVIAVKVSGSEDLTLTPNHMVLFRKHHQDSIGIDTYSKPKWIEAGHLRKGYLIGYRVDPTREVKNRPKDSELKDIARLAEEKNMFPRGVFDLPIDDQKRILTEFIWNDSKVISMGRGTYVALGARTRYMAYSLARMARNCYQAAVDIDKDTDPIDSIEFPYLVKIMINTNAAESLFEKNVVWQPVREVTDEGRTAHVYGLCMESKDSILINDLICRPVNSIIGISNN